MMSNDYTARWLREATKEEYWDLMRKFKPETTWEEFEPVWEEWCALKRSKELH